MVRLRYDADEDGRLGFWEFSNIFLPVDPILRDEVERRKQDVMTKETIEKVKTLLRLVLDTEGTVENIRQTVTKSLPISLRQIFD